MTAPSTGALPGARPAYAEPLAPFDRPRLALERPVVRGRFLNACDEKLTVRGVTYGPFGPRPDAPDGWRPAAVERDFAAMALHGINAVRVYAVPPRWLLDAAARHGLRVLVGIPWEQHITFLDDRRRCRAIAGRVRDGVRACAGHEAVLAYALGNEIPAPVVRWHGRRRVEQFLRGLYLTAKAEDPDGLVTYVNFPSTEYLQLPFLDLACFNVYLEAPETFGAYLARLHNLAGDLPLLMAEIGLDSARNGLGAQATALDWQVRMALNAGCAGAFVFAWTDEWHRGGQDILDWDFGLTTRTRAPKPALASVAAAMRRPQPDGLGGAVPRISVVVCTRNGARTLHECLAAATRLDYADYETIVVSDGSTDETVAIARELASRVIEIPPSGLSHARNVGLAAATGEIVAYLDDDAAPDRDWLTHLARAFAADDFAGVGGPNVPPPHEGRVAQCVAHAPGGPTHVLVSDTEAEHIPGCNMAFRRSRLEAIDGFDTQFHIAGDDVDVCWRLQERGWRLGFAPSAVVLHRRRATVAGYLRQQRNYGRAEAMLERKWPEKYSAGGHVSWRGRLYGNGSAEHRGGRRWRIYYGGFGTAPFQSLYGPRPGALESLPLMPEFYLALLALAGLSVGGALLWTPLLAALPLLVLGTGALLFDAVLGATRAWYPGAPSRAERTRLRALTAALYLLQPLVRLQGRLGRGLTPLRRRGRAGFALRLRGVRALWHEEWAATETRLAALAGALRADGSVVACGGDWDRWDLQVRGGTIGVARLRIAVEEHGGGRQLVRVRWWPHVPPAGVALALVLVGLGLAATVSDAWPAAVALGVLAVTLAGRLVYECGTSAAAVARALGAERRDV